MRKVLTGVAVVAMMLVSMTGIAAAQTPTMTVTPTSVDAAGSADIEVSLSGFSPDIALFVLPCDYPAGGDLAALDTGTCDQANLTPIAMDGDGAGTLTVTYDIPAEGITIIAGDAAQTENAFALVSVGAAAELAVTGPTSSATLAAIGLGMFALGGAVLVLSRRTEIVTA